jgi:hypothetical protein
MAVRILALALALPAIAQESRVEALCGAELRIAHEFSSVAAVRELPDGRLVIVDASERSIVLADPRTRAIALIGRQGRGPREYLRPVGAVALPDGRTLIQDPANARFLELAADGSVRGPWAPRPSAAQADALLALLLTWDVRGADSRGRLYFDRTPPPLQEHETASVPVVRFDPALSSVDTVATYAISGGMQSMAARAGRPGEALVSERAWPARSQWVAAPDGAVAIVEPAPYRVSWVRNGASRPGPAVSYSPVRVSADDRAILTDAPGRRPRGPSSPGGDKPAEGGQASTRKILGAPIFPEVFPPFEGREAVRLAPDGTVWVTRAGHLADSVRVVDVFDTRGALVRRVALPPHRRLAGFGATGAYLVHRDADDFEFVERYPLPFAR